MLTLLDLPDEILVWIVASIPYEKWCLLPVALSCRHLLRIAKEPLLRKSIVTLQFPMLVGLHGPKRLKFSERRTLRRMSRCTSVIREFQEGEISQGWWKEACGIALAVATYLRKMLRRISNHTKYFTLNSTLMAARLFQIRCAKALPVECLMLLDRLTTSMMLLDKGFPEAAASAKTVFETSSNEQLATAFSLRCKYRLNVWAIPDELDSTGAGGLLQDDTRESDVEEEMISFAEKLSFGLKAQKSFRWTGTDVGRWKLCDTAYCQTVLVENRYRESKYFDDNFHILSEASPMTFTRGIQLQAQRSASLQKRINEIFADPEQTRRLLNKLNFVETGTVIRRACKSVLQKKSYNFVKDLEEISWETEMPNWP